jgi:enoyl-CoA hydratase/carnithine racemase
MHTRFWSIIRQSNLYGKCTRQNQHSFTTESLNRRVNTTIDSNGVARVELTRPEKLNALDLSMFQGLVQEAKKLRDNTSIRAVIFSGKGRAFCTGLDIASFLPPQNMSSPVTTLETLLARPDGVKSNLVQDVAYLWRQLQVPVVAVVHGMCYGGGLQIALGADFRFCDPSCKFSVMESKWGLIPDMSASITLRELVRTDVAKELAMTGRIVMGVEAASLGLVTRCCEQPMEEAEKLVAEILTKSPDAIAKAKQLFQTTWVTPEEDCLKIETDLQRELLPTWNQLVASGRNFGLKLPYSSRKEDADKTDLEK